VKDEDPGLLCYLRKKMEEVRGRCHRVSHESVEPPIEEAETNRLVSRYDGERRGVPFGDDRVFAGHIVATAGNFQVHLEPFPVVPGKNIFEDFPPDTCSTGKGTDDARISHHGRCLLPLQDIGDWDAYTVSFDTGTVTYHEGPLPDKVAVHVEGVLVECEDKINFPPKSPLLFRGGSDDGKIVPSLDQGGVVEVHVCPVTDLGKEVGDNEARAVDPVSCSPPNEH